MTITLNGTTGITTPAETVTGTDVWSVGSTQIYKDTSGNVGIGTSSPTVYGSYKTLEVRGTGGGLLQFGTGATTAAYLFQDGTNSGFNNIANGIMTFGTNNTERMRIDSSGNLFIGSTTGASDERLYVETTNADWCIQTNNTGSGTFYHIGFRVNGNQVGRIQGDSSSTQYLTSSDYRLKENIAPMTGALAKVTELRPVTYTWKATGEASQGFIAHELQAIVPECVAGEKDAVDENGNPEYQGIDTSFLVATLTAAIQELKAELDTVKTELATLKGTANGVA